MSIETLIAEAVAAQINARFDALERKIDATNAVLVDVNQQIRDARASLEQAIAECPCDDVAAPTPAPVPVPTPAPVPAPVDPPGSVRWQGSLWTIVGGKIQRDGAVVPETELTANVVAIYLQGDVLTQKNAAGDEYQFTGKPHWKFLPPGPVQTATITASGSISAP